MDLQLDLRLSRIERRLLAVEERFERVDGWRNAMMKRPDLLQMKLDLEKQDITLRYDRNQLFPSLDVLGSYGWSAVDHSLDVATDDIGRGAHPTYSYGVVLSVPFSNKKARDNLKATQETKKQALLRLKKLELELLTQVENSGTFLETSLQRVGSTRKARQYSEAALQSEQSKFRAGTTTSFLVLEFQNKLTIARSAEIRALADYNKARAQLAFSEGTTLEKNNITLNLK